MGQKILIAGGTGLVGKNLTKLLINKGFEVSILSRSERKNEEKIKYFRWRPYEGYIEEDALQVDHIINLAGAGIADRPWTSKRKKELSDSRLLTTNLIHEELKKRKVTIKSYVGASAIGYYGDGGDDWQSEIDSNAKDSYMINLCKEWEHAHQQLQSRSKSVSIVRIGLVLSNNGGAYPKIRMPFKFGTGSYFGSGNQYYSWIHIDDLSRLILFLIQKEKVGIYNGVTPNPYRMKTFTELIKKTLKINALLLPVPAFLLITTMGQMSKVLLNSNRVSAKKILDTGFEYNYPDLPETIMVLEES